MTDSPRSSHMQIWWPMIAQTIMLLGAAWSYTTAMERRLSVIETTLTIRTDIINDLKTILSKQDDRLRMLEANQTRILALEEFVVKERFQR